VYELLIEDSFDAAHALRGYDGPCENLHGHTWKVQVFLHGKHLNKIGLLQDFKVLKKHLKEILDKFDHKFLNDIAPFNKENPSSENLAKVIFEEMKRKIRGVSKVTVWESTSSAASYF